MWTDHHGKTPDDADAEIKLLQTSLRTGQLVEVSINGVRTRYSENTSLDWQSKVRMILGDLQEYRWRLGQGHDYTKIIRPRAFRNRQTIVTNL